MQCFWAAVPGAIRSDRADSAYPGFVIFVNDQQLVVADRFRIVFRNDYLFGDATADGVLAQSRFDSQDAPDISHHRDFKGLAHDKPRQLLYAAHGPFITAWRTVGGLKSGQAPAFQIASPIAMRQGGLTTFDASSIAVDSAHDVAWISDQRNNRVLRIVNVSQPGRYVDLILGQANAAIGAVNGPQGLCNRGKGRLLVAKNGFCESGQVALPDPSGNLFVIDGAWEGHGNARMLQFDAAALPPIPSPHMVWPDGGPMPARVYGKSSFETTECHVEVVGVWENPCAPLYVAFQPNTNNMLMTSDAYSNTLDNRVFMYTDPVPSYTGAIGSSGVYPFGLNEAGAMGFDSQGTFAILDHTWNRVLVVFSPPTRYISLLDSGGPYFVSVPAPITVEQQDRYGPAAALPLPLAASDAGEVIVTSDAPSVYSPGMKLVNFFARDTRGRMASTSTTVTVQDTTPPLSDRRAGFDRSATRRRITGTPVTVPMPTVTDNCECAVVTSDAPALFPVGTTVVTFRAIDAAGKSGDCHHVGDSSTRRVQRRSERKVQRLQQQ